MKLDVLLSRLAPVPANAAGLDVRSITDDSRAVTPGTLFVARSGTRSDGRAFVADAVARGAAAVLFCGDDPCAALDGAERVVRIPVPAGTDLARLAGALASRLEGTPSDYPYDSTAEELRLRDARHEVEDRRIARELGL